MRLSKDQKAKFHEIANKAITAINGEVVLQTNEEEKYLKSRAVKIICAELRAWLKRLV